MRALGNGLTLSGSVRIFISCLFLCFAVPASAQTIFDVILQEAQRQEYIRQQREAAEQERRAMEAQRQAERAAEAARLNAIKQAWSALDANVNLCVDRNLKGVGQSVDMLVQQGVTPSDPRLADLLNRCNVISSARLMKGVQCTIEGTPSVCDEEYVFTDAPKSPLTSDQLVTALIGGRLNQVGTTQIEVPAQRARRLAAAEERRRAQIYEQITRKIAPLATPDNAFSYKQAASLQKTINAARTNPNTTSAQLTQWSVEADRLVAADRDEKIRVEKEKAEKLARGEVDVKGSGSGATVRAARLNAYWDIFLKQLRDVVSTQADGELGKSFRKEAEANFDKFRADYFTSGTSDKCVKANNGQRCDVVGTFKVSALKSEIQKIMAASVASTSHDYRFILRYPDSEDETTRFLIAQISAEAINQGYKIVAKSAEDEAEATGQFDFYMNILDIRHDMQLDATGNLVTYILSSRLKLINADKDPSKRLDLANVPVSSTRRTIRNPATPLEARKAELLQAQGAELAVSILKELDARLLTIAQTKQRPAGAVAASVRAPGQYSVKIVGLSHRDRERIRSVRNAISSTLKSAQTAVDPKGTDEKSVEITFEHAEKFDPEDVVDALYAAFKDRKQFKARYNGNNSFTAEM